MRAHTRGTGKSLSLFPFLEESDGILPKWGPNLCHCQVIKKKTEKKKVLANWALRIQYNKGFFLFLLYLLVSPILKHWPGFSKFIPH
jgi:hypothetical protein